MSRPTEPGSGRIEDASAEDRELLELAIRARDRAHAPYSGYRVGAAARAADGSVHVGCNVEISSYGLTVCAERVALFAALAAGATETTCLAVVGPGRESRPTPPCGACRQVIFDLAPDARILLATPDGEIESWSAEALLPRAFGPRDLA